MEKLDGLTDELTISLGAITLCHCALDERRHHHAAWEQSRMAPPFRPSQYRPPGFFDDFSDLDQTDAFIVGRNQIWRMFKRAVRMG